MPLDALALRWLYNIQEVPAPYISTYGVQLINEGYSDIYHSKMIVGKNQTITFGSISAQSFTEQYPDSSGILSQAINSTTKSSTTFNIQDHAIQNNFKKLQSNFSKANLAKCG